MDRTRGDGGDGLGCFWIAWPAVVRPELLDAKARAEARGGSQTGLVAAGNVGSLSKGGRAVVQEGKGQQAGFGTRSARPTHPPVPQTARVVPLTANYTNPQVLKELQAYLKTP